jgi:hypothetical protein
LPKVVHDHMQWIKNNCLWVHVASQKKRIDEGCFENFQNDNITACVPLEFKEKRSIYELGISW